MNNREIDTTVKKIKALKIKIEALEAEKKTLEEIIKTEMLVRETNEITTNNSKIKWTEFIRNVFDTVAFKAENSPLYARYVHETTSRRFSIA